ncbi:MAG: N-acetylmuramoyl-L-alanine amidase [Chitinispirillales bacterium]|nr:N-acetylmuramoyl-L-alanine amidase [Chitinispirillales bacterium]
MRSLFQKDKFGWALVLAVVVMAQTTAAANVTIRTMPENKTHRAHSFRQDGAVWVSVTDFAEQAGFRHGVNPASRRQTFSNNAGSVSFVQGNRFYMVDTEAFILPFPPTVRESRLYLPVGELVRAFGAKYPGTLNWDEGASTITVDSRRPTTVAASTPTQTASTTPAPRPAPAPRTPDRPATALSDIPQFTTIVIDPGHGGRDPGAIGPGGAKEKDVTLAIGLELRRLLRQAGLTVYMTRDTDVFVPLRDRTNFANQKRADLFVSIHANAVDGNQRRRDAVRGYKIYFLSQAKNEGDQLSAMRENAVVELEDRETRHNYDALQDVLISIAGNELLRESQELSIIMEQTFGSRQSRIPRLHLGVGQANFWVLNGAFMPSVLVEVGFISNTNEEKLLTDNRVQTQLASALSESILKFKTMFEAGNN